MDSTALHGEISMEHLNVEGLPEPIVRGLEVVVEIARKLTGRKPPPPRRQRIALGVRKGHGLRQAHPRGNL
jgi:hypothetical protein